MKKTTLITIGILLVLAASAYAQQTHQTPPDPWPRVVDLKDVHFTVYQPQLDSWDGYTLQAHAAVAVQTGQARQPVYGVLFYQARTLVDRGERLVRFEDFTITEAKFPSAPDMAPTYLEQARQAIPKKIKSVALDRLEADMAILEQLRHAHALALKNDPPQIIFSQQPSLLVFIDGAPRFTPVKNSALQRVLNTRVLMVKDAAGKLYLRVFDGWMEAGSFQGPWRVSAKPPQDIDKALLAARESGQVDLLVGQTDLKTKQRPTLKKLAPVVFATFEPTELIMTEGAPSFVPLAGVGELEYVKNSSGNIFRNGGDQKTYILLSGRWFKADTLAGPWRYVPVQDLPAAFAKIPDDGPKENVKASVPGTRQAKEAVIAAIIPQSAKIDRKKIVFAPRIDGNPVLTPIAGTPLVLVSNSVYPMIKVDEHAWYACVGGVWFVAKAAKGPWAVADSIPAVIYSIPPSSPVYYVTYVRIFNATPDAVYVGYTAGYYGSYITADKVVVHGTGYAYTPWVGTSWYGPPVTYGLGSSLCWTPWHGWSYGYGFGWWQGYYPPAPYWGPYYGWGATRAGGKAAWGPGGWASTTGNVYHLWGSATAVTKGSSGYNAFTGPQWSAKYGLAYNSTTGALIVGRQGSVANVYTGGKATVAGAGGQAGPGQAGVNAFATPDGHVYVNEGGQGWNQVTQPDAKDVPQAIPPDLDRQQRAREIGQQRANSFYTHQPEDGWSSTGSSSYGSPLPGGRVW